MARWLNAIVWCFTLVVAIAMPAIALERSIGGSAGGGLFAGGTLTSALEIVGVNPDITTPANEDLTLTPGGTGLVRVGTGLAIRTNITEPLQIGTSGQTHLSVQPGSAVSLPTTRVVAGRFGGDGTLAQKFQWVPRAVSIASPTDTSTVPAHHLITVSATGAAAWTPSETSASNGECFRAINTGSNAITMTDSSGVYEGGASACVLGQWDAVTACYVSDRWVEVACRDN